MSKTKSIWLPFMLLVMLVHIFSHGFVLLHYKLNYKFISEKLCENRAKPQMNCNGKCHIKKTLKQLNNPAKEKSSSPIIEFSQYIVMDSYLEPSISFNLSVIQYPHIKNERKCIEFHDSIFHPPLV
jgi:hypothetical protein